MYCIKRIAAITILILLGLAPTVMAGEAEDQYVIAAHHYSKGRWNLAVDEFVQFLADHPQHARADAVAFFLAESLVQLGRYQEAHQRYAEYLQRSPQGKYAQQGRFRVGETLYLDGQHAQARPHLEQFATGHADDPLCAYALPYLGEIALISNEPKAAERWFEQGLKQFAAGPLVHECRFGLARALESQGDSEGAIRFYKFLGGSDERTSISDDALLQMAILLYQQRRFDEAIEALTRHREQYPGSELAAHAAYWLGLCQTSTGAVGQAATTLSEAARRYPNHELTAAMEFGAGEAYRRLQDVPAAQESYQRVLQDHAQSDWADDSQQMLVQLAWDQGNLATVIQQGEQFVQLFGDSQLLGHVQQTMARAHLKNAEFEQAIPLLNSSLELVLADKSDGPVSPHEAPLPDVVKQKQRLPANVAASRYYLALALLGTQRHEEALGQLDLLRDVQEPKELASGVHVARASALIGLERHSDAIKSLHLYLTVAPNGPDAEKCRAQLAVTCARLERWSETGRVFRQMRDQHKDHQLYLSSLEYMAEAAYAKNQRDLAREMFSELADDSNPEKYVAQGLSGLAWLDWTGQANTAGSAENFEKLLKRFPDSPLAAEAAMMRGQALENSNHPEGALAMYELVMARYSDSTHVDKALLAAARIRDTLQRDGEAEPLLRSWLAKHPSSDERPGALYQLAWVLVDLEREDEADEVFEQIYERHQTSRYWADATYRLAERAARAKDGERAESLAKEIVLRSKEPQMVAYSLYLCGQLAAADKRWKDAVEPLQRLVEEHPESAHRLPAEYWLAEAHFRQRQYDVAGGLFDKLDAQTKENCEPWVAMIPLRRAQVYAHRQQWKEAFEVVSAIESRFPDFAQQHEVDYLIGRYYASRAEFEKARESYERVIRSQTGRAAETAAVAQWMIGETYFMQKQYNRAIKAYFRVEALFAFPRWKAAALLQAGKCHEMVGRWTDAVELYARVVNDFADTPFGDKAARRLRVAQQRAAIVHTR